MKKKFTTITIDHPEQYVLLVTLNRPNFANAFNTDMGWELINVFEDIALNPIDTRAIILTGQGNKAFSAGGDLKERKGMSDVEWGKQHLVFERMVRAIIDCPVPTIGAINGVAFGGGCELAAALDFIYCSKDAKFAQTETKIGIIPGAGGTQTLARAIGENRAKEMILTGTPISAQQGLDWGLVNAIFPADILLEKTVKTAKLITENAPIAVRQAKQAIHRGLQLSLRDGLAFEIEAYNRTIPTKDRREGVAAFNEKRTPIFSGK